jgi:pimeloyl-ACP methyl ester carboxylesterase
VTDGGPLEIDGVTHRFVEAGGLRVHLAEAGDGDPILLLHGWPQHRYMWRAVIERLHPITG